MAAATATLTGDLSALVVGAEFNPDHIRARITTNLPPGVPVVDTTTGGALHFGPWELDLDTDGKFTQAGLLRTNTADTNPTGFQYYVEVAYYDATRGAARNPLTWRSTPFSLTTATADLRDLLGEAYAPPQWKPVSQDQLDAVANAAIPKSLIDAKGDLIVGTANDTAGRLAAGPGGRHLFTDPSQSSGLRWSEQGEGAEAADAGAVPNANTALRPGVYYPSSGAANLPLTEDGFLNVDRRLGIIRQTFYTPAREQMFVRSSINGGTSWTPWREVSLSVPRPGATLSGLGSPEGSVSALPGTSYIDTAVTNGALVWRKWAGAGATGWRVEQGDTGWRDVTNALVNGWAPIPAAGNLRVRRVGKEVFCHAYHLTGVAATANLLWSAAPGFMPNGDYGADVPRIGLATSPSGGSAVPAYTYYLTGLLSPSRASGIYGLLRWSTAQGWPTTLPGDPA